MIEKKGMFSINFLVDVNHVDKIANQTALFYAAR